MENNFSFNFYPINRFSSLIFVLVVNKLSSSNYSQGVVTCRHCYHARVAGLERWVNPLGGLKWAAYIANLTWWDDCCS